MINLFKVKKEAEKIQKEDASRQPKKTYPPGFRGRKQVVTWGLDPEIVAMVKAVARQWQVSQPAAVARLIVAGLEAMGKER